MELPIEAVLPRLLDDLRVRASAVLVAPPGAGKTTRVPLAVLQEPWVAGRRIILLSPRRVAARAAAARMAQLLKEEVGRTVGYRVRLENRTSSATRIEVVTEGVFARMIQSDPSLEDVAAVLFDEFHERSLDADLGLALALDAQSAFRPDLRLLVMSATLDGARVAALLDGAPTIVSEGRMHPVTERYLGRKRDAPIEQDMADAIASALAAEPGSILCFLPGAREIERTRERLTGKIGGGVDVHVLYGALDPRAQDAALSPSPPGRRKVVLATSIAETSLTIDGVRVVIDCGLSRRPRYEPGAGLARLETVRASRASAEQRKGRAGRLEPGVCWRLWEEPETRSMVAFDRPEIMDADLTGLVLDLTQWGARDPASLRWLDPPPAAAWRSAVEALEAIGALDGDGAITDAGKVVAALPVHPRLGHMIVRASQKGAALTAAMVAVLLSEQGLGGRSADLGVRLEGFSRDRSPRAMSARKFAERLAARAGGRSEGGLQPDRAGALMLSAFPERVAKARGKRGEFLMANGRAASMDPTDPLAGARFLVVADVAGRADRALILSAATVDESDVVQGLASRIEARTDASFDLQSRRVRARRTQRLGAIVLADAPLESPEPEVAAKVLLDAVRHHGFGLFANADSITQLRGRVTLMRSLEGDVWPDFSEKALLERADEWLAPLLLDLPDLSAISDKRLERAMLALLDHGQRSRLDVEAPTHFLSPTGATHVIDYAAENGPALDIRLQELFGTRAHPSVAQGRTPLLVRLLSPAHRPVQTTRDLPGFWTGSYAAVRSEMRGRYPRHPWPDDPLTAEPTRRAKPKGS